MTALKPGRMVTPAVRLVRHLGDGGMGSVWVAAHLRLETASGRFVYLGHYNSNYVTA